MKKNFLMVFYCSVLICFFCTNANAALYNFTIEGTFAEVDPNLASTSNPFIITGSYESSLQPEVVYGDGSTGELEDILVDFQPYYYMFRDYSAVTSLDFSVLDEITSEYTTAQPFNGSEVADGTYSINEEQYISGMSLNFWALIDISDYYELSITHDLISGVSSGFIRYNYYEEITGDYPDGIYTRTWKNSTLELNIDNVEITSPVPEPATMFLLGSGIIGLSGFRTRRFKKKVS